MALLERTRTVQAPTEARDAFVRWSLRDGEDGPEMWCEWRVQLASGKYDHRSARVDADVVTAIIDAGLRNRLLLAANNTYPKVTADL